MDGYELTRRPDWAQGHQVQVQWSTEAMTPAAVEHNLTALTMALEMAGADVREVFAVRDRAQNLKVAYAALGLAQASVRASWIVGDAERVVAQAPTEQGRRNDLTPDELVAPGATSVGSDTRSKIRKAHEPLADGEYTEIKERAIERGEPYTRKAVAEVARAKAREDAKEERKAELAAVTPAAVNDRWSVECLQIDDLQFQVPAASVDIIFTDPPYGREWLDVYDDLAMFASHALRDDGILICLTGHAHLPSIIERLNDSPDLRYLWTACYQFGGKTLTQPASHQVLLQVGWKPILLFGKMQHRGSWFANASDLVLAPEPELGDDRKERHKWGQQLNGMTAILRQFTRDFQPGALVVDPFCGSGTNGVAALELGFRFRGADADADACAVARGYINERYG